jgi:membrane protein YqaA with SNARE-associated domain
VVELGSYLFLAGSAFVAATLLPFYSEVVLVALLMRGGDPFWLFVAATVGNTLGAVVNWYLGGSCCASRIGAGFRSGRTRCTGRRLGFFGMESGAC